jgi:hypothetical protein
MEIEYQGIIYFIPKEPYEPLDKLSKRAWYIAKHKPQSHDELMSLYRQSFLWYNVNTLGCHYDESIMSHVTEDKPKPKSVKKYLH